MKFEFIPIDYEAFDFNGKNYIKIIGRNDKGKRICLVDSYLGSFWVILKEGLTDKKIKDIQGKIEEIRAGKGERESKVVKTELHDRKFLGKEVKAIKVFVENFKDAHSVADEIGFKEVEKRREYDLNIISKYIIDKKILPLKWYEVEGSLISGNDFGGIANLEVDACFELERIKESERKEFEPRFLAFDIEVDKFEIGKGDVLMISLYGKNFKKVLTWKKSSKKQDYVEVFKDEEEMLRKFSEYVYEYAPDFLVGYFSDGFDLPYLRAVAEKNKVKLELGLDRSQPKFSRGNVLTGRISGLVHVDIFRFIRNVFSQYLQSETLSLNDVASELLGEKKHDFDFLKLGKMKDDDWYDFFSYNLQDSKLTYELMEKIWLDIYEFTKIVQEPVFEVTRNAMSSHVEDYIIHNLERFNEIAEKRPVHEEIGKRRGRGKYEGAFVFQPTPGLYEDIGMFDFTSMYGSVIVSYNLSLSSFHEKKEKGDLEVDLVKQKVHFSKEKAFFPTMLGEFIEMRKKYKKEYNENKNPMTKARSNAYKLLANAAYGYQGFFGARYYCLEAAASTAALARENIHSVIDKIKKQGYTVIYSDTDSVAFLLDGKNQKETLGFLKKLNSELPGIMELDLEDFYKRALFVSKRTTDAGAKKKYALISYDGKLKIRGFETVRRDWCKLARRLQSEIIESILKNGNEKDALEILKDVIMKIKKREVKREDLIIRTQLKKPISEYLATGPHVIAAKKMEEKGIAVSPGDLIEFYVAEMKGKKKLVREKVKLPDEEGDYEIEYYLNNQILPATENIFEVFKINLREVIDGNKQTKLF